MRRCIFCHEPLSGNRAREHVLPRWLEREIGQGFVYFDHPIEGDTASRFTIGDTDVVSGTASTRVEGRVCSDCNSSWLSSLEVVARPVVSDMVFGRRSIESLAERERLLLATWLYKTLLVGVSSGNGEFDIHGCDFHQFRATGLPGHWVNIYAAVLDSSCRGFCGPAEMKWPRPVSHAVPDDGSDTADLGLKWVYHIGGLHVVACHSADATLRQVVIEGLHHPLWTPQPFVARRGGLVPEVAGDSLLQWLAYGLLPVLMTDSD